MGFVTHFQGIYMLRPHVQAIEPYGCEALLRCIDGEKEQTPVELFSAAKMSGGLIDLDIRAFKLACLTFALHDPGGLLFVNIFPDTLCSANFTPEIIADFLAEIEMSPSRIVLEVVEGRRLTDMRQIGKILQQITTAGLRFALDDFGIGTGDIESWLDFHPHVIKFDRALIHGIAKDKRRQKTILALEHMTLGSDTWVVFEGLENADDAQWLRDNFDTPLCQGFLFDRPAPLGSERVQHPQTYVPRLALCS